MSDLAIGIMSGTSLDGVTAALVRLDEPPTCELVRFRTDPYQAAEREAILHAIHRGNARDLALLHVQLGRRFAEAAQVLLTEAGLEPAALAFVACHGQTIWHEPGRATLQLGDPAVIAETLGVTVTSDFRTRDVAAGGQGAPLVPIADALLFGRADGGRALLNIGGIANVSWVPRLGVTDGTFAFDTGPGVAIIDGVARLADPGSRFDVDGSRAARGRADSRIVDEWLKHEYFQRQPPKSTGRELFGESMAADLRRRVGRDDDALATAVAFTARSIADQLGRWVPADKGSELVISGGGARNPTLVRQLKEALPDWRVRQFAELFFDGEAKEAVAFALLGWLTMHRRPGNVPSATGARGPRVLGRITPP